MINLSPIWSILDDQFIALMINRCLQSGSPTQYAWGWGRGSEQGSAVSCLILDHLGMSSQTMWRKETESHHGLVFCLLLESSEGRRWSRRPPPPRCSTQSCPSRRRPRWTRRRRRWCLRWGPRSDKHSQNIITWMWGPRSDWAHSLLGSSVSAPLGSRNHHPGESWCVLVNIWKIVKVWKKM